MHRSKYDLAVLLIFFARPNTLSQVFEKIKDARPSKLFLACDGPREGRCDDVESIEKCKKIVSDIDWECEVYTRYSQQNQGCGKGPSNAIDWAFSYVDQVLVLEDDCVPDDTLFPFMEEMLKKYKNDERVGIISGFNHMKNWECGGNSYCFTKTGATLGWGTWKRVWEKYDYYVEKAKDEYYQRLLLEQFRNPRVGKCRMNDWKKAANETKNNKVNYWDIQFGFLKYINSYLCVVPCNNLIYNIGVGAGSTHTENNKFAEWKKGRVLFMPTDAMRFPLVHPQYVICDHKYDKEVFKILYPNKMKKIIRKIGRMLKK